MSLLFTFREEICRNSDAVTLKELANAKSNALAGSSSTIESYVQQVKLK